MAVHQIVCDGTSMAVILGEFGELYRAARQGTAAEIAPAPPGYGAFVAEQLAAFADGAWDEDLNYWAERLAGAVGSVLPGDSRGPAELHTYARSTTLDAGLTEAVTGYARRAEVTPFAVLLGTMSIMIATAADIGDVSLGTTTSSRTPRFGRTVGMLTNMVVHRSSVDPSATFADTLAAMSLDLLDAIDYQDVPFSRVSDRCERAGRSGVELVRTTFSSGAIGGLTLGEGSLAEQVTRTSQGPFDLTVVCEIAAAGIAIDWQYALRTYSPGLARGYCDAYQEFLTVLLDRPDVAMDSLGLTALLPPLAGVHGPGTRHRTDDEGDADA